jgi:hypothetical protein
VQDPGPDQGATESSEETVHGPTQESREPKSSRQDKARNQALCLGGGNNGAARRDDAVQLSATKERRSTKGGGT